MSFKNCITYSIDSEKFAKADTKLYVLVVTLSKQLKLLKKVRSEFKRTFN